MLPIRAVVIIGGEEDHHVIIIEWHEDRCLCVQEDGRVTTEAIESLRVIGPADQWHTGYPAR